MSIIIFNSHKRMFLLLKNNAKLTKGKFIELFMKAINCANVQYRKLQSILPNQNKLCLGLFLAITGSIAKWPNAYFLDTQRHRIIAKITLLLLTMKPHCKAKLIIKNRILTWLIIALILTTMGTKAAPPLELKTFDISNYEGQVVYLDFWASWCLPCKESFPFMNSLKAKFEQQGLSVVSINTDYVLEDASKFLQRIPANFEVIYDPRSALVSEFQVQAMPTSFLFNRQGKLIGKHIGFKNEDIAEITAEIEKALEN